MTARTFSLDLTSPGCGSALGQIAKALAAVDAEYRLPGNLAEKLKATLPILDAWVGYIADQADVSSCETLVSDQVNDWLTGDVERYELSQLPRERSDYDEHNTLNRAQQGLR